MATGTIQKDMVLLWTNPNPNNEFSAQTISLDLSNYDAVAVVAKHWSDNDSRRIELAMVGADRMVLTVQSPTDIRIQTLRLYKVTTSGVQFQGGKGMNASGGTYNSNQAAIPLQIYGIKA